MACRTTNPCGLIPRAQELDRQRQSETLLSHMTTTKQSDRAPLSCIGCDGMTCSKRPESRPVRRMLGIGGDLMHERSCRNILHESAIWLSAMVSGPPLQNLFKNPWEPLSFGICMRSAYFARSIAVR
eukprot:2568592-Amphidinium_carterae.2